jgi:hypothetical protein
MNRTYILLGLSLLVAATSAADAQRRYGSHYNPGTSSYNNDYSHWDHDYYDHLEDRRDARRAGVATGLVGGAVTGGAPRDHADEAYQECLYATGYDHECERRRYRVEQRERQIALRSGVAAGALSYGSAVR